ncbi:MAG: phosphoribosylamine--glycine ligase [Deltaproteobacteria bacterium]|nr:phosphoribosylamine--glycine ligase [Deltaproteobacteria bacterium]
MKILVIGSGGREHALAWKLGKSPLVTEVHCAPGNPGMARCARCHAVSATDLTGLLALAQREAIDLTVVGPEAPLAAGIVDLFHREGCRIFGPSQRAAELESSKAFAKTFLQQHGIPTAHYGIFTAARDAHAFLARETYPIVIKADGLAAGKGVVIAHTRAEAESTINAMLGGQAYGDAGRRIVIEEFLQGEEISCIAMVDGERYLLLEGARDHKALGDGDLGPNTGGMGAYTPSRLWTPELEGRIRREIMEPTIDGLRREGRQFTGFLYAGLMIIAGKPYVLEFNVRLGDPEAQALLFRLRSDLAPIVRAAADGKLGAQELVWDARSSCCVVMAAAGYPDNPRMGDVIHGVENAGSHADVMVFHAGTTLCEGHLVTQGGRVLGVTALGSDLLDAQQRAYAALRDITWKGAYYRTDIGRREL